jgi:hypothetical protein
LDFFSNDFFQSAVQVNNEKKYVELKLKEKTNEFLFRSVKSGNEDLAVALTDWVFKQRGVLRARNIRHYLKSDKTTPSFYTIKNDIVSRGKKRRRIYFVFFRFLMYNSMNLFMENGCHLMALTFN